MSNKLVRKNGFGTGDEKIQETKDNSKPEVILEKSENQQETVKIGTFDTGYTEEQIKSMDDETWEQLKEKICKAAKEFMPETEDLERLRNAYKKAMSSKEEPLYDVPTNVHTDTLTGLKTTTPVSDEEKTEDDSGVKIDFSIEEIFNNAESWTDVLVTPEIISGALDKYDNYNFAGNQELKMKMMSVVTNYYSCTEKDREEKDWYAILPEIVQQKVMMEVVSYGVPMKEQKRMRKIIARTLLQDIVEQCGIDKLNIKVTDALKKLDFNTDIPELVVNQQHSKFEYALKKTAEKYRNNGNEEAAKTFEACAASYENSWTFENLISDIKKKKIKMTISDAKKFNSKIDIIYKRFANAKFDITNPSQILPVVARKFRDEFSVDDIIRFFVAFFKYVDYHNLDANNIVDTIYMVYFIDNMTVLDATKGKNEDQDTFIYRYINNLRECIRVVNEAAGVKFNKEEQ